MASAAVQVNPGVSPLSVRCTSCGAQAHFDLRRQNYHCLFCGESTDPEHAQAQLADWQGRELRQIRSRLWSSSAAVYSCPGCGSAVLLGQAEELNCVFCGSPMNRGTLSREMPVPALALPFSLSLEEAKARLKSWAEKNALQKEARRVLGSLDRLEAYYLPVQLLQGGVDLQVSRHNSMLSYLCQAEVEGVAVNASAQLDGALLSAAAPFDWSKACALDPARLGCARIKLRDVSTHELQRRIGEELSLCCQSGLEQAMHTDELFLQADASKALQAPALVPVFLLNEGGAKVIINGQTGRIAVCCDKPKRSRLWLMEPLILSLLASLLWIYAAPGNLELFILGSLASTILFFSFLSGERGARLHRRLFRIRDARAERLEGRFLLSEDTGILPPQMTDGPVFYRTEAGQRQLLELRYLTLPRVLLLILGAAAVLLLPYLLACLIAALSMLFGGPLRPGGIEPALGAAWYVAAAAALLMGWLNLGRSILFDQPLFFRPKPDGGREALSREETPRAPLMLWSRLRNLIYPDALVGLGIGLFVVLLGSVLAMLFY